MSDDAVDLNSVFVDAVSEMPETPAAVAEATETPPAEATPAGDIADALAAPAAAPAAAPVPAAAPTAPTEDDFSDARPWTSERAKNASALIAQQKAEADEARSRAHDLYQEAVGRAKKHQKRFERDQAEKQAFQVDRQQFLAGVNALRQGSPEQRVHAIQFLTGQDGVKWLTDMNYELASGGQARQVDPAVAELRQTVAELKRDRVIEAENAQLAEQTHHMQSSVNAWKSAVTEAVASRADIAPISANIAAKAPGRYAEAILAVKMAEHQKRGQPIDDRAAVDILEAQLRNERDLYHPSNGTTGSGPEAAGKTAAANPSATPTASMTPSMATEPGGGHRPMTEREAIQAVANELPEEFWSSLGA